MVAIMMIATTIQAQIPTNGLVAYYPFTGNANDSSGNGNNGVVNGATLTTDRFGKTNSAYSFDGKSSLIKATIPNLPQGNFDRTISVWVNTNGPFTSFTNGLGDVIDYGSYAVQERFSLLITKSLTCYFSSFSNDYTSSIYAGGNLWKHIILTYKSGVISFYLDGVLKEIGKVSSLNTIGTNLQIGNTIPNLVNQNERFSGKIDDIAIYNRVLDSSEIQALYHEGGYDLPQKTGIPTNGLVAWYPFTGNATDSSGNGNNGSINGATLTTDRFGKANSAYNFDGISNNIYIQHPILSSNPCDSNWSISFWFLLPKNSDLMKSFVVFSNGRTQGQQGFNGFGWFDSTVKKIYGDWYGRAGLYTVDSNYNANTWYNLTYVYTGNNSKLKVCVNGYDNSGTIGNTNTGGNAPNLGNWYVGSSGYYSAYFKGKIDDIRLYNRALDSIEIQALYHEGGYNGNTLPIKLEGITASILGSDVVVKWQTSTELNTNHFIIQRSNDGIKFTDLGFVKAIGSVSNNYQFKDLSPVNGTNYYRLKSIDKDGSYTYGKIISVNILSKEGFTIVPNPAVSNTTLRFNGITNSATINVFNVAGKKVYTDKFSGISSSTYTLSTSKLSAGTYIVNVITKEGNYSNRLVITK